MSFPSKRKMCSEITDENEDILKKIKENSVKTDQFCIQEVKGDIFSCAENESFVQCVSQDFKMNKGIALLFKNKFGGVLELQKQHCQIGGIGVLKRENRYIYYLVTKEKYFQKPTYFNIRSSLEALKKHAIQNNVFSLSMPKIGCGLDSLSWDKVKEIITSVYRDTDIKITIYYL